MPLLIAIAVGSAFAGIVQEALIQSLRAPWSGIELPLLVVVAFVTRLRLRDAVVSALAAGLAADAVSAFPAGARTTIALIVVAAVALLATRVLSHRSLTGTIGITCAAYLLHRGGEAGLRVIQATINGVPAVAAEATPVHIGLGMQLAAALILVVVSRTLVSRLSRVIFIRG